MTDTMHPDDLPPFSLGGGAAQGRSDAAEKERKLRCPDPECADPIAWHPTAESPTGSKCERRRCLCVKTQEQLRGGEPTASAPNLGRMHVRGFECGTPASIFLGACGQPGAGLIVANDGRFYLPGTVYTLPVAMLRTVDVQLGANRLEVCPDCCEKLGV